jgi:hypothetical protein
MLSMSNVIEQIVARQNQLLEFTESWQKPVLSAVSRTAAAVESRTARLPKFPNLPFLAELPKPSELWQVQLEFASKLMENNKKFILELTGALEAPMVEATEKAKGESDSE